MPCKLALPQLDWPKRRKPTLKIPPLLLLEQLDWASAARVSAKANLKCWQAVVVLRAATQPNGGHQAHPKL
jgi:hypothetical protein